MEPGYPPARARALAELVLSDFEIDLTGPTPRICAAAWELEEALGLQDALDERLPEANPSGAKPVPVGKIGDLEFRQRKIEQLVRVAVGANKAQAKRFAEAFPTGQGILAADIEDLEAAGLTEKQAERLHAALTLGAIGRGASKEQTLTSPSQVGRWLRSYMSGSQQEQFVAILLDSRQRPFHVIHVAKGSLAQVDVHPRELFRDAVRLTAHSVIMAHNHPSGDARPSQADLDLTRRMVDVGKLMGIPVLDHVIVTEQDTTSMAAMGIIPV